MEISHFNENHWICVNDIVMGGVSSSTFYIDNNDIAIFQGNLSLENNGGFVSVKSSINLNLSEYENIYLEACGDKKIFKFILECSDNTLSYRQNFVTEPKWKTFQLPLNLFAAYIRGKPVEKAPPLNTSNITKLGLLLADKQEGNFRLAIKKITAK